MSLLNRLAGLPAAWKETWKKTFGDGDAAEDVVDAVDDLSPSPPSLPLEQAWAVVGVRPHATLDDVRAAARARARSLQAGAAGRDTQAARELEQLALASELLEEHLLPAVKGSAPAPASGPLSSSDAGGGARPPSGGGRVRATPRG
jgi:hypothetical protein